MQTIVTQYHSATATKPARIKATAASGLSIWCSTLPESTDGLQDHARAADTLRRKLNWPAMHYGGMLPKGGAVWVFNLLRDVHKIGA